MVTVLDMMKRLEAIRMLEVSAESIEEARASFIKQQQEQLFSGKRSDGRDIRPFYKKRTIAIKLKKGQPVDRVTLKDRGDFYNGIFLVVKDQVFTVDSTDYKTGKLQAKYSPKIFGLGGTFKSAFTEDLKPVLFKNLKARLGLI